MTSKYAADELISIIRPVVYVLSVVYFGRRSWKPLKISAVLDLVQIIIGVFRLYRSNKYEKESAQLKNEEDLRDVESNGDL